MAFPLERLRRLKQNQAIRDLVCEDRLSVSDLILPLFVGGDGPERTPLPQIPGCELLTGKAVAETAGRIRDLGIPAVLLFGIPDVAARTADAVAAYDPDGATQRAVALIKEHVPELVVITDLCLCEFTDHGHCGLLTGETVDNDRTLACLARAAVSHAEAGADAIAPSGMMDGTVAALRCAMDKAGKSDVMTIPYSAKFASNFYGPFKSATQSTPADSKHATHQLPTANARETLRKVEMDINEGADMVIVKPALPSLDILHRVSVRSSVPVLAYNVSGTYRMLWEAGGDAVGRERLMMETLTCIKRAGADMIITYYAESAARSL